MADWIWYAATEKNIMDVEIDILHDRVAPRVLQIQPITGHLHQLRENIQATLKSNQLPDDFITEAKFIIFISQQHKTSGLLTCQGMMTDKEGRKYIGKIYTEKAYEDPFTGFPYSLLRRIKRMVGL